MRLEKKILVSSWIIMMILLVVFVPKNKIKLKEALVIFFFKHHLTWLFGAIVVEKGLIRYPYREFKHAIQTSFTFEFFVYPALCVLFNLYHPQKSWLLKILNYVAYTSLITVIEVILEKHTRLIKYVKWHWYDTWITICGTFLVSHLFYTWFFKSDNQDQQNKSQQNKVQKNKRQQNKDQHTVDPVQRPQLDNATGE